MLVNAAILSPRLPVRSAINLKIQSMRRLLLFLTLAAALPAQKPLPNGLYAVFQTSMGNFKARLYEKDTPITVTNFVGLATGTKPWRDKTGRMVRRPLYDNITFHRVVRDEIIQAGDPTGVGNHNCGFTIRDEFLPGLRFNHEGKLAMANSGAGDSASCQFFVTSQAMPQWDGKYAIFGTIVEGQDVVDRISRVSAVDEKPVEPVKLITVLIERIGPEPQGKKK
jgi:peptidyl-prolyl cis-trans isomerase A (cyclophilin A)